MNILYILGNGFDLAQNMKTSYANFYQYLFDNNDSGSFLFQKMKQHIQDDIKSGKNLWSDMELGFGNFSKNVKSISELDDLHYEISQRLQAYLKIQNLAFSPTKEQIDKFERDFINPWKRIYETDRNSYGNLVSSIGGNTFINVMSLNYTDTLEKLLEIKPYATKKVYNNGSTQLTDICHVHGRLDDTIIWGVDNDEQIRNSLFKAQDDVKMFMVKSDSNLAMKSNRYSICENYIKNAHLIVLFGVSLGETDSHWWKLLGKEMKMRKNIGIIECVYRPNEIPPDRKQKTRIVENKSKQELLEKMELSQDDAEGRFFFVINSSMFSAQHN